jgi:DNA-binding MarR family transcriptional regulator
MGLLIAITLMRNPSINTLSEKVMMDRTTLSRNLKPLELQSLIRVEAGEDKRIRLVKITKKGQASLMEAIPLWEEVQNRIIGRLGQNNWKDLLKKLNATAALSTLG